MSNRGLAVLCVRLFAIGLVVYMLYSVPGWYARSGQLPEGFLGVLLPVYGLGAGLAAWMWLAPGQLAGMILPQRSSEPSSGLPARAESPAPDDIAAVLLFCGGFLLAAWSVPELLVAAWRLYLAEALLAPWEDKDSGMLLLARGGQFVLGLWLCLGRRGWLGAWRSLRRAGTH